MKLLVKKGATSYLAAIFIQDSSSSTGAGLTGLTSGSAGLTCYRSRSDDGNANATQIVLSGGTRGTWSSGGFVEKDATNMPGVYELGIPDAAIATGSNWSILMLKGATNMAPLALEMQLTDFDPQDAVHLGLSAIPNASPGAANGLFIAGTNAATTITGSLTTTFTGNLTGSVASVTGAVGSVTGAVGSVTGNVGGNVVGSVASVTARVTANADQWAGGTIPAPNVTGVPLIDLKYTLGTISPATAGSVRADAVTGSVGSVTGAVGSVTGAVGSVTGNVGGNVTGSVGSIAAGGIAASSFAAGAIDATAIAANAIGASELASDAVAEIADGILDRDMSTGVDSGSTTVRTARQALRFLRNKWSISGTTLSVFKEDDSTTSWSSTLTTNATAVPITANDPAGP